MNPAETLFKDLTEQKQETYLNQENKILFSSHLLQGEHSITLGIRVTVPVEVGCCVSLHSGEMSAPAGEPLCGTY